MTDYVIRCCDSCEQEFKCTPEEADDVIIENGKPTGEWYCFWCVMEAMENTNYQHGHT